MSVFDINTQLRFIESGGTQYDFVDFTKLTMVTYSELLTNIARHNLIPGNEYCITDYQATTTVENTSAATHGFWVIVKANSQNSLSENARASRMKTTPDVGYYAGCDLDKWEIKYTIENKYWSDYENGKGTIYYMKDDHGNEAPYDFKNIMFKRYPVETFSTSDDSINLNLQKAIRKFLSKLFLCTDDNFTNICNGRVVLNPYDEGTKGPVYLYTFSNIDETGLIYDYSLNRACCNNKIGTLYDSENYWEMKLPQNIICGKFISTSRCEGNIFGDGCYSNVLYGESFVNNTFANGCYENILIDSADGNTFETECSGNLMCGPCSYNKMSVYGIGNILASGSSFNSFGVRSIENRIGIISTYNTIGDNTYNNILDEGVNKCIVDSNCIHIYLPEYLTNCHIGYNAYLLLANNGARATASHKVQNVIVEQAFHIGSDENDTLTIDFGEAKYDSVTPIIMRNANTAVYTGTTV